MHPTARDAMRQCIEEFMPADRHYRVIDFGSRVAEGHSTHSELLTDRDCSILGVDIGKPTDSPRVKLPLVQAAMKLGSNIVADLESRPTPSK